MEEIFKIVLGIGILILGVPIGSYLAGITEEELPKGQFWFKIICILGVAGGFIGLLIKNDFLLFGLFFVAIVASRSIIKRKQ